MFQCKKCGRKFKSMQALGGHVGRKHPQEQANTEATPSVAEEQEQPVSGESSQNPTSSTGRPAEETVTVGEEPSEAEQIQQFLKQGYTFTQLTDRLGFKSGTVRQEIVKMIPPEGQQEDDHEAMPVTVKGTEAITPEFIMQRLADSGDDWQKRLEGVMLMRAAQKMNREDAEIDKIRAEAEARRLEPLMKMIQMSREEMDAAAQRTRESQQQVAHQAAGEAAAMAAMRVDERFNEFKQQKKDIADTPDPMKGMVARMMETIMNQLTGQMFGSQGGSQGSQLGTGMPPGWEDKTKAGGK